MNAIAPLHALSEVPAGQVLVTVMYAADPDRRRQTVALPAGDTLARIVATVLPGLGVGQWDRVMVRLLRGDAVATVERRGLHLVRPRAGVHVCLLVLPGDPGILTSVFGLLIKAGASAIAGPIANTFGLGAFGKGLITLGLTAAGGLLLNLIFKPRSETRERETYAITGWRNELQPNAPVPAILGELRVAPRHAAYPYTEVVGNDIYVRALFEGGYGPVEIDQLKIGDTPISEYQGVETEIRTGTADDAPITLYPHQVIEESAGVDLTYNTAVTRFTADDAAEASVILVFPQGLIGFSKGGLFSSGGPERRHCHIAIHHRLVGATDWLLVANLAFYEEMASPFFRTHRWALPSRGRWEVRLTRTSEDSTDQQYRDKCQLFAVQSFRPEGPIAIAKPTARVAVRIKSSAQLTGMLDNLNWVQRRVARDWDGAAWVWRATRNCAAAAVWALTGPALVYPAADTEIDWPAFEQWHDCCVDKGLYYDRMHDFEGSLEEVLQAIGAAGRAKVRHDGTKWTVVIDRPRDVVVDVISPRNAADITWSTTYFEPPHAVRIEFLDRDHDWRSAECLIPWPPDVRHPTRDALFADLAWAAGKRGEVYADPDDSRNTYYEKSGPIGEGSWTVASMDVTIERRHPGVTSFAQIWRAERRLQYEQIHRSLTLSAAQPGHLRAATPGDLLMCSRDVFVTPSASARVLFVDGDMVTLDEAVTMEAGTNYAIRWQAVSEDDTVGTSHLRALQTVPGESASVLLTGTGALPSIDDLVLIGPLGTESVPVILTMVERGNDGAAILKMLPAAPIIDDLTDAEVVPPWSPRVGTVVGGDSTPPGIPVVRELLTGLMETGTADGVILQLRAGAGVAVGRFEVRHRLVGAPDWSGPATAPVGAGGVAIAGYAVGAAIEMQPRAVSIHDVPSGWGATIAISVGEHDAELPDDAPALTVVAGLGHAVLTAVVSDPATKGLRLYRNVAGSPQPSDLILSPFLVDAMAPVTKIDGDSTRTQLLVDPTLDTPSGWTHDTGWSHNVDRATHASGSSGDLSQAITIPAGKVLRLGVWIENRVNGGLTPWLLGGSTVSGATVTANGLALWRLVAGSGNTTLALRASSSFNGSVVQAFAYIESPACVPQGTHRYFAIPINRDEVAGPAAGPVTVTII
jgi:hypothetical protein